MKQTAFAFFVAFWASCLTLLTVAVLAPTTGVAQGEQQYSLTEVSQHNELTDCWMAIEGKVYDFSDYVPQHPTPPQVLAPWCGKEATEGVRTKGYGRDHSPSAWAMMEAYEIGILVAE